MLEGAIFSFAAHSIISQFIVLFTPKVALAYIFTLLNNILILLLLEVVLPDIKHTQAYCQLIYAQSRCST